MKKADALRLYGTGAALARAVGVTPQAVSQWGELIPELQAARLALQTLALTYNPEDYGHDRPRADAIDP